MLTFKNSKTKLDRKITRNDVSIRVVFISKIMMIFGGLILLGTFSSIFIGAYILDLKEVQHFDDLSMIEKFNYDKNNFDKIKKIMRGEK